MPRSIPANQRARVLEARELWQRTLDGDLRARVEVMETLTTSDFPILLGAAYGRELLQEYAGAPSVWAQFSTRTVLPDFRKRKMVEILGGRTGLSRVKESTEYPARSLREAEREFSVDKYGDRFPLTWEMLVNDDLNAFRNLPARLATAARETEDVVTAKSLFNAGGTGLNTSFFKSATNNAPDTLPLTQDNVDKALTAIQTRTDGDKRPIVIPDGILMVPPALESAARRAVAPVETRRVVDGVTIIETNPLAGRLEVVVNPWLALAAPGFSGLNRTWFILPRPNGPRPAVVTGFLAGNEVPDLRVKADAGNRVGGGSITPEEGSFDDDTIQYRVRHVTGSSALIPDATYVSTAPSS